MGKRFPVTSRAGPRQWVALTRALELCRTQSQPVPWAPQLTCWSKAEWAGGPQGKGCDLRLNSLSISQLPPPCWLNPVTNCGFLAVGSLGAGPTAAATSDWAGPLVVTPWQFLVGGACSSADLWLSGTIAWWKGTGEWPAAIPAR